MSLPISACIIAVASCAALAAAPGGLILDHQRDSLSLGGTWEVLVGHGEQEIFNPRVAAAAGPWKTVDVPSANLVRPDDESEWKKVREQHATTKCVWVRRTFELTEAEASRDVVLRWGGIRFGAAAWINGKLVTRHVPVGPHTALLGRGILKAGTNRIVLKVPGWGGVPRSAGGYPLTPTGGATQSWGGKGAAIYQDIWLEFYDSVYAKWVLAMPDVADKSVTFRIWLDCVEPVGEAVQLQAAVRQIDGQTDLAAAEATAVPGSGSISPIDITCRLGDAKLWTPQTAHLYEAEVRVRDGERTCDTVRFRFGMRQVTVRDGRFSLNGERLWLRGSNLVNEWLWGDRYNENVKQYIIDEARSMNLNCFRTHTQPPPPLWLSVADQHGMMILAETPLLYNYADFKFTPEEMWNHPSVVIWVLSNESRNDNEWEAGPLYDHVKAIDPTRLSMRTGETKIATPDMVDTHTCFNVHRGGDGLLLQSMTRLVEQKDPARPLCNTEYMNRMGDPAPRWLGRKNHPDMPLAYAECAAEHTEAMRRLRFDCLLPYMYAGWTRLRGAYNWRDDFPTPMAAALHSSMAPVLASLETFDRNYAAGRKVETGLVLINETHSAVAAKLDLYITPQDPLFVPDPKALAAAVWQESIPLELAADSIARRTVHFEVPQTEGAYYLAAVLTREGDTPVVSQRVVRSVDAAKTVAALAGRRIAVLGADETIRAGLAKHGCEVIEGMGGGAVDADVVLIWDASKLTDAERQTAAVLRRFAEAGGRIAVANQTGWSWIELADVRIGLPEFGWRNPVETSRVHPYDGADHPMLQNIPATWLWRWNGMPGVIANEIVLESQALRQGRKILWATSPKYTAVLALPVGAGEIVFCQLKLRGRVGRDDDAYDPVAERVLTNLLTR